MELLKILGPILFLLVLIDPSVAWSQKTRPHRQHTGHTLSEVNNSKPGDSAHLETSESKVEVRYADEEDEQKDAPEGKEESKVRPRYAGHLGNKYILEEEDDGGKEAKEYQESDEQEEHQENDHLQGYHNVGKKVEDETSKDYHAKGGYSDFKEGGATFDKHHRDHVAENKENENVKAHDAGEKFGSEALKEHKLGKHREKSVGHKKHGFKNVYHKEEYGDHKTFHDEFLDNDHHHEYDDQHENRQMSGGKFSKGYKREGENKEFGEGDEAHAWGKNGHDGYQEGAYEKGGHLTGHHLGHKKDEGHHEANGRKSKFAARKFKKGEAPLHGNDQPQYYAPSHGNHVPSDHEGELPVYQDGGGHHPEEVLDEHEERTPQKKVHRFPVKHLKQKQVHPELIQADGRLPAGDPLPPSNTHSPLRHHVQYGAPQTHNQPLQSYHQPLQPHHQPVQPIHQPLQPLVHHRQHPAVAPNRDVWSSHFSERQPYRHQHQHGHHQHRPHVQHRNIPVSHLRSSPYPWWRHSTSAHQPQDPAPANLPSIAPEEPRFSQPLSQDESQAPSYSHLAHARAPVPFPRYL